MMRFVPVLDNHCCQTLSGVVVCPSLVISTEQIYARTTTVLCRPALRTLLQIVDEGLAIPENRGSERWRPTCVHWILAWRRQSDARRTEWHGGDSWRRQRPWHAPEEIMIKFVSYIVGCWCYACRPGVHRWDEERERCGCVVLLQAVWVQVHWSQCQADAHEGPASSLTVQGHCALTLALFEKTCEATQKNVKSHVFLDFENKTLKNVPVGLLNL